MKVSKILLAGLVMVGMGGTAQAIQVIKVNDVESRDGATFYIPAATGLQFAGIFGVGEDPAIFTEIDALDDNNFKDGVGVAASLGKPTWSYINGQNFNKPVLWDGETDKTLTLAGNDYASKCLGQLGDYYCKQAGTQPKFTASSTVRIKKYEPESITLTPMKATKGQTVSVSITIANEDANKKNDFYVVALLSDNSIYSCTVATPTACSTWTAGIYPLTSNSSEMETQTVATQMDLTGLGGTTVYAGYAWSGSGTDKIGVGRYWKYTSQKIN